jgi:periplasmic divalent cation tolerance protein
MPRMEATSKEGGGAAAWVVLVTAPDVASASALSRALVERRLAACVNRIEGVTSVFRWKQAVEEASEVLLVIKTSAARIPELERFLAREHPYEVPELVALEPAHVAPDYLAWLLDSCASPADG